MLVVPTGLTGSPGPGLWRRLSLMCRGGSLSGLTDQQIHGRIDDYGVPRHLQPGVAYLLQSWQCARVPPDVAMALWLLRQEHRDNECLYWGVNPRMEESTPAAVRYAQLAVAVGETLDTDPTLAAVVQWLLDRQLPDGGIPLLVSAQHGWAGQTARLLRVLHDLRDTSLVDPLDRMDRWLTTATRPQTAGAGWPYSERESTAVTGSTSLAVLALMTRGERGKVVQDGLTFLVEAQENVGGWAEVPGHEPTLQHSFEALRTICTARDMGLLDDVEPMLAAAQRWFQVMVSSKRPRTTAELSYAIRLAAVLDGLEQKKVEQLAVTLTQRRRETLSTNSDLFSETELGAIALLECSRQLDRSFSDGIRWTWRWDLPGHPPPFLSPHNRSYFYELLYGAVPRRWWIRFIDRLMAAKVLEQTAGLLFGAIVALGVVNPDLIEAVALRELSPPRIAAAVLIGIMSLAWLGVKLAARSLASGSTVATVAGLAVAVAITWIMAGSRPLLPDMLPVVGVKWVVIDAISFTSDRTGLLDRLLPKS